MLLFICHASEDKADFVRPLAEALKKDYEVWYDEYQLTLGDSLLQKINEGLSSCDFGVVVFSPVFFEKKWTQEELGGLFALEGTTKKIILPVIKDLTHDEFAKRMPTMAGRFYVSATEGLERVIEEIKLAVGVSERKRQLSVRQAAALKLKSLDQKLKERSDSAQLLNSYQGATLVANAAAELFVALQRELTQLSESSEILKFQVYAGPQNLTAYTAYRVSLSIRMRHLADNSAILSELVAVIFLGKVPDPFSDTETEELQELTFKPLFRAGEKVAWADQNSEQEFECDDLIAHLLQLIAEEVKQREEQIRRDARNL